MIVETNDLGEELPRIVDFGIAILRDGDDSSSTDAGRLTTAGLVLGTPQFMAPEQACAEPIDHRVDLFALGVTLYQMLCGLPPFSGTGVAIAHANVAFDPPPMSERAPGVDVDPRLEAFARKLMARNRNDRPPSARAARELLDSIYNASQLAIEDTAHAGMHAAARSPAPSSRRRWRYALVGVLAGAVIVATTLLVRHATPPREDRAPLVSLDPMTSTPALDADVSDTATAREPAPPSADTSSHAALPVHAENGRDTEPTRDAERPAPKQAGSAEAANTPLESVHPRVPATPPARPPITPANFSERYAAVHRALKQRGTNDMWTRFLRIDLNTAMSFPDKQREAIATLADLERELDAGRR